MTPITIEPNSGVKQIKLTNNRGDYNLLMKTSKQKPKQKSVTILDSGKNKIKFWWSICCPNSGMTPIAQWCGYDRFDAWWKCQKDLRHTRKYLKKQGYRAVKGKFVWEEK